MDKIKNEETISLDQVKELSNHFRKIYDEADIENEYKNLYQILLQTFISIEEKETSSINNYWVISEPYSGPSSFGHYMINKDLILKTNLSKTMIDFILNIIQAYYDSDFSNAIDILSTIYENHPPASFTWYRTIPKATQLLGYRERSDVCIDCDTPQVRSIGSFYRQLVKN